MTGSIMDDFEVVWALIKRDVLKILRSQSVAPLNFLDFKDSYVQIKTRNHNLHFVKFIYEQARELSIARAREIMTRFSEIRNHCELYVSNFNLQWALYAKACENLRLLYKSAKNNISSNDVYPKRLEILSIDVASIGLSSWYNVMLEDNGFQDYLMNAMVNLVQEFRQGDRNEEFLPEMKLALENLTFIYHPRKLHKSDRALEVVLKQQFFTPLSETYIEIVSSYLERDEQDEHLRIMKFVTEKCQVDYVWIEAIFPEEPAIVDAYMFHTFYAPVKPILLSTVDRLFKEEKYEALARLYKADCDGIDMFYLTSTFDTNIQRKTTEIVEKSAQNDLIEALVKLYAEEYKMIKNFFRGDSLFLDLLNKAVAPILNKKTDSNSPCKSTEKLAKLLDTLMRNKDLSEIEIEEEFDRIGPIYQILLEKDVFERLYTVLTAKRLLQKVSRSLVLERALLKRLPQWGMMNPTMIYNINAMIEDVLASDMMLEMFNISSMVTKNENDFVFSAQVMKSNTWPIRSSDHTQIELSGELKAALVKYESIHRLSYDHRKLIWNYQQSKCEMAINYLDKPYMLSMNTYQMAIILLFEKNDHLGFMDIKETLSIPEDTLIDQLACLVESKLLIADPKVFSANCQLSLNFEYRNANTKVKIPSRPEHREAFLEKTEDIEIVLRHRRFIIQAAIVRFAKRNSPVSHDHLLSGVRQILEDKFELEIPMFERATADLIDGKYLVEDLNNKKLYRYHVP